MSLPGITDTPLILQKYGYRPGQLDQRSDSDIFLNLLTTQLRNQNPLEPLENGEFIQQVSQLAAVEQTQALNAKISELITIQEIVAGQNAFTQSASLVGKTVEYIDPVTGEETSGKVTAIHMDGDGLLLDVNGEQIPMNQVTGIIGEDGGDDGGDDDDTDGN
jgi:flagellar basal-body rod modification protein FlgD